MKRDAIRSELSMEIIVGTFVFLILLVMGYFTIILSRENVFKRTYPLHVCFNDVMGLHKGDVVAMHGMDVGKVTGLKMDERRIRVACTLGTPLHLKTDYRITIRATSVLGGRVLDVFEGSTNAPALPENEPLYGEDPYDTMTEAAVAVHEIRKALTDGMLLDNVQYAALQLRDVAEKLNRGEGTIGKLLKDDAVYENLRAATSDGKDAIAQLKVVAEHLNAGQGTLGKLMTDDAMYTNLEAVVSNMRDISDRLAAGKGMLGKLMSEDDTFYKDLTATAASLKDIAARIDRGEGSLGKMLRSDDLYQDVRKTVGEARGAIDDFRETAPVLSFTSILFGAL